MTATGTGTAIVTATIAARNAIRLPRPRRWALRASPPSALPLPVLRLDPRAIGEDAACGRYPLRGLLAFAARRGLMPRLLRLGTSADASGDTTSVVGYGAFAFA